jgi:F-type H+-transporting ATPase subunit alpha
MVEQTSNELLELIKNDILTNGPETIEQRVEKDIQTLLAKITADESRVEGNFAGFLSFLGEYAEKITPKVHIRDVGTVQHIGNGVATLSGFQGVRTDELVTFPTGVQGLVLNLGQESVDVILLGSDENIRGGDLVTATGNRLKIPVGPQLLGRVINPLGKPLDDFGVITPADYFYLERDAPGIIERTPVNQPLQTGLKIIDALLPIGRGQRELIVGDRQTGKTSIAVDAILNQKYEDVDCVYVAIGQKKSSVLSVINTLRKSAALNYTCVILSSPDDPPALRYLAPYTGASIAEYLLKNGRDVLIIYDDLSKHADAYRELSLLLRRPPGREAYPGDIFYLHSRLLERACKLDDKHGGGSITALPIVTIQQGNISAYIPTNLISITDGQIILDSGLFNQGVKPAVDVGRSVSRVGGAAQTKAMRVVSGDIRLQLAQFEEVSRFAKFGTEVDPLTAQQIERGKRLQKILMQSVNQPIPVLEQIIILFSATEGLLRTIPLDVMPEFERNLIDFLRKDVTLLQQLERDEAFSQEIQAGLRQIISEFSRTWLEGRKSTYE